MTNLQRFRLLRLALALCGAAIVIICAAISYGADTPAEILSRIETRADDNKADVAKLREALKPVEPAPEPEPPQPPVVKTDLGTMLLQPLFHADNQRKPPEGSRRISEAELRQVEGMTIRIIPQFLSVNGKWDFKFVDECVALCRKLGKGYTLLLAGGGNDPLSEANLAFYESAAKALGERYSADPLCWGAHVTGASPTGHSEELFWGRPMPPAALAAVKRLTLAWATAFPRQVIPLAGTANDVDASRELIAYGNKVAPGRFLYKNNAMSAKSPLDWASNTLVIEAGKAGALIGFEMLDNSSAQRFGGTFEQSMAKVDAIEKAAGKRISYLAIYRGDVAKARK